MLSHTAEYALRGCLELARRGSRGPVPVEEIATTLDVPRNYLSKIFHDLGHAGIVASTRGRDGGFEFSRPPERIRLEEIVRRYDSGLGWDEESCILGTECGGAELPCAAHEEWGAVSGGIRGFFSETTLADLIAATDG